MRPDLPRVITERQRGGGSPKRRPRFGLSSPDLLPQKQGMHRPYVDRKWALQRPNPLRRWLRSRVGHPWNSVYSEVCVVLKSYPFHQREFRSLLFHLVKHDTFLQEGAVCCFHGTHHGIVPVKETRRSREPFFVDPQTGRLQEVQPPWVDLRPRARTGPLFNVQWKGERRVLVQVDGLWYECQMAPFPARFQKGDSPLRFDRNLRRTISRSLAADHYGRYGLYCESRRQLGRPELRRWQLTNQPRDLPAGTPAQDSCESPEPTFRWVTSGKEPTPPSAPRPPSQLGPAHGTTVAPSRRATSICPRSGSGWRVRVPSVQRTSTTAFAGTAPSTMLELFCAP